jgi:ElaB/YqjD/DUF883 family membrane-anchored ribosome-binding protein
MAKPNIVKGAQRDIENAKKEARMHLDDAKKALEDAKQHLKDTEKKVEKYIKNEPVKAVAIAAGVGAIIGAAAMYLAKRKQD